MFSAPSRGAERFDRGQSVAATCETPTNRQLIEIDEVMELTAKKAAVVHWLNGEFAAEQQAGFPTLRRVPDTQVIRFLDHFESLDQAGQLALKDILIEWSSFAFIDVPPPNPSWKQFSEATVFPDRRGGRRYTGVQLLAALSKDANHQGLDGYFQTMGTKGIALEPSADLVADPADLVPIAIPSLRRKVQAAFSKRFEAKATDLGSEIWSYAGKSEGCQIIVEIRYSGKMSSPQLAYQVQVRGKGRQFVSPNLCFESILGVGFGRWDYLTKENTDCSLELLCDLVAWVARLPDHLPKGCCEMPNSL